MRKCVLQRKILHVFIGFLIFMKFVTKSEVSIIIIIKTYHI